MFELNIINQLRVFKRVIIAPLSFFFLIILLFPLQTMAAVLQGGDIHQDNERESISRQIFRDPSPMTGAYIYDYQIKLPPGRNGLAPDLSLTYSSQSRSNISPVGYGWSINIPSIERIPRHGLGNLYDTDEVDSIFFSSLDGEVIASSTILGTEDFGPLIENGNFRKYEYKNNVWWKVTNKSGTVYTFGQATSTRQNNPDIIANTFK